MLMNWRDFQKGQLWIEHRLATIETAYSFLKIDNYKTVFYIRLDL